LRGILDFRANDSREFHHWQCIGDGGSGCFATADEFGRCKHIAFRDMRPRVRRQDRVAECAGQLRLNGLAAAMKKGGSDEVLL
jgi:hypothetical protein